MFSVRRIQYLDIARLKCFIGWSKLPYNDRFTKCLACSFWWPAAHNISPKGKTGLYSDNMWYDREYVTCHMGEIGVLWVRFLLLGPPVCYVRNPKCTANLYWFGLLIIEIWINLSPVLWCFRQRIQIEPCRGQWAYCSIASSVCHLTHIVRH